jgi:integrase
MDSLFILGMLQEGYLETTFEIKNHKVKARINKDLAKVAKKLKLSIPLNLCTARDCYVTTHNRAGVSRDDIGEMLGHSNSIVTEHYLASMEAEKTFKINSSLLKKTR